MPEFGQTGIVLVKVDREIDPWTHIDRLREKVYDQDQRQNVFALELQALKNSDRAEWTKTGIWDFVKGKLDEEKVDWFKWFVRGAAAAIGSSLLGLLALVLKFAWKGLTT